MKLIIINGSPCSGKSSVIKNILKNKERYFHLSFDGLKWSFSQYESGKYYEDVQKIILIVADAVFKMGYNVISDATLELEDKSNLMNLANSYGYEILEINLEASFETLSRRFDERVESALANPEKRIANVSKERFKEIYEKFQSVKDSNAVSFSTDNQKAEDVAEQIMKLM